MSARDLQDARVNARAMSTRWEEWAYRLNAEGEAKYKEEYTAFYQQLVRGFFLRLCYN